MNLSHLPRVALATLALLVGSACAPLEGDVSVASEAILERYGDRVATRSDVATTETARAVGWLETRFYLSARGEESTDVGRSICTVTLVAPNVAITAAHCVSYQTCTETETSTTCPRGRLDAFVSFEQSCESYRVAEAYSFSSRPGTQDIALIRLASAVPDSVARPRSLASEWPSSGSALRTFGYGYGHAEDISALGGTYACVGWKRFADSTFDAARRAPSIRAIDGSGDDAVRFVLPGDSGGPTFDSSGRVLYITSAFGVNPGCFARRPDGTRSDEFIGCPADGDNFGNTVGQNPDTGLTLTLSDGRTLAAALRAELTRLSAIAATETATCQSDGIALQLRNSPSACPADAQPSCESTVTRDRTPAMPTVYRDESDAALSQFRGYVASDRCTGGQALSCLCTEAGWSCEDATCATPRARTCSASMPGCNDDVLGQRVCEGSWGYVRQRSESTLCPGMPESGSGTWACTCRCTAEGFAECSAAARLPTVDGTDSGTMVDGGRASGCSASGGASGSWLALLLVLGLVIRRGARRSKTSNNRQS